MAVTWSKADIRVMLCAGGLRAWADDDAAEAFDSVASVKEGYQYSYTDTPVAPSSLLRPTWTFDNL
jgi:hypothetical protein